MNMINAKKELAYWANELAKEGLAFASCGNISTRQGNCVFIKKTGTSFKNAQCKDFTDIRNKQSISIEWRLHKFCYDIRPDIGAVVHTHPFSVITLAAMGVEIKPTTIDFALYIKKPIKIIPFFPPGSVKLAKYAASVIKNHDAVIMDHHGLVTVGQNLKQASTKAIIVEKEAKIMLSSLLLKKKTKFLTPIQIKSIYKI